MCHECLVGIKEILLPVWDGYEILTLSTDCNVSVALNIKNARLFFYFMNDHISVYLCLHNVLCQMKKGFCGNTMVPKLRYHIFTFYKKCIQYPALPPISTTVVAVTEFTKPACSPRWQSRLKCSILQTDGAVKDTSKGLRAVSCCSLFYRFSIAAIS